MADIVISGNTSGSVTLRAPDTSGSTVLTLPTSSGTLVVTGGAQTVQFAAGSAAAPSITFTGDTNTGIFSPAADTIAFSEGGVESMRINSSGFVGLNSPSTLNARLTFGPESSDSQLSGTSNNNGLYIYARQFGISQIDSLASGGNNSGMSLRTYNNGTYTEFIANTQGTTTTFQTAGAERMRIDGNGNVGIGTSSPSARLSLSAAQGFCGMNIGITGATGGRNRTYLIQTDSLGDTVNGGLAFYDVTALAYRMFLNSSGDLLVGTNSYSVSSNGISLGNNSNSRIQITNSADFGIELYGATTNRIGFAASNSSSRVGSITVNTTNTAYNTSSDYRLKENIAPMTGALEKVALLKPCTYTWKVDGSQGEGFIAHELAEVVPQAVTGEKDGVDKDGNPDYQAIDVSFLVATLTAAIQELNAKVEAQAAEIAALKGVN